MDIHFVKAATVLAVLLTGSEKVTANDSLQADSTALPQAAATRDETATITVIDKDNEPVIGASVVEKGTANGAVTDLDGRAEVNIGKGRTICVSYVGCKTLEITSTGQPQTVVLEEEGNQLGEVVVVGYGTQKKVNLTGAVANVNVSEAVAGRPVTDVAKALQGITPGLTVTNQTGGVGTESTVRLRGSVGSLSATSGTQPLILVDNVEVPSLNLVNPDDIETISVLKDAASASIYGTRAAWGVILITTKKGKPDEDTHITYSNNFAWNTPTKMPRVASASDNADFIMEVMKRQGLNSLSWIGYTIDDYAVGKIKEWESQYGGMSQGQLGDMQQGRDFEIKDGKTYFYRSFDAVDEFVRKWTPQQQHNLSITGGSKKSTYNISLGYLRQNGVMKYNTDTYDRYTVNSSVNTQLAKWWKAHANVLFTRSVNDQPYRYNSGQYDAWFYLLRWPRWYPYAQYEGKDFRSSVTDIKQGNRESVTDNYIRINLGSELTPAKGVSINVDYTFSLLNSAQKRNGGRVTAYNMFATAPFSNYTDIYGSTHDRVVQASRYTMSNIFKAYATWQFDVHKNHQFKIMAGMDAESREQLGHYSERRGLISSQLPEIALATGAQYSYSPTDSYHRDFSAAGFFGRINYNFMQRYLLEVNARYDGSSRFPSGKKWALFPSVSAGWRVSEEPFMQWATPLLSDFKIRGSWGTVGNQDVADNSFVSTMSTNTSGWVVDGVNQIGLSSPTVVSSSLTWERITTTDIGFDARLLNGDLGVTFDWYRRVTSNMHCAGETLPLTFGATVPKVNYGELTGHGIEIAVDYSHRFASGLQVTARASFSHEREIITKYSAADRNIYGNYEGKTLGEIWGYVTDRLFQTDDFTASADGTYTLKPGIPSQALFETGSFKYGPGDVKYADLDGDGKITYGKNTVEDHGDLQVIGNSLPDFEYSFTLGAEWKGFDFSIYFQGVGKHDYWAYGSVAIPGGGSSYAEALYEHQTDYWTPQNTDAFYPRPSDNAYVTSAQNFLCQTRYLCNMAYLRCKNLTLGYTLPRSIADKIKMEKVRVYFSAENLFEIDNMHLPVDPESTDYKVDYGSGTRSFGRTYPYSRTVSFGIQVTY